MTEQEWQECQEPSVLLRYQRGLLGDHFPTEWSQRQASTPRKWRLFGGACARRIWRWLDLAAQRIVEITEQLADTPPDPVYRGELQRSVRVWHSKMNCGHDAANAVIAPFSGIDMIAAGAGYARRVVTAKAAAKCDRKEKQANNRSALDAEARVQSALLRCIFGTPFRPAGMESSWLAWNDGTVVKLARGVYEDRAFDRLPILGDALEDAGCDNLDILAHCRTPRPHVRGCWVVDLLTGRR